MRGLDHVISCPFCVALAVNPRDVQPVSSCPGRPAAACNGAGADDHRRRSHHLYDQRFLGSKLHRLSQRRSRSGGNSEGDAFGRAFERLGQRPKHGVCGVPVAVAQRRAVRRAGFDRRWRRRWRLERVEHCDSRRRNRGAGAQSLVCHGVGHGEAQLLFPGQLQHSPSAPSLGKHVRLPAKRRHWHAEWKIQRSWGEWHVDALSDRQRCPRRPGFDHRLDAGADLRHGHHHRDHARQFGQPGLLRQFRLHRFDYLHGNRLSQLSNRHGCLPG